MKLTYKQLRDKVRGCIPKAQSFLNWNGGKCTYGIRDNSMSPALILSSGHTSRTAAWQAVVDDWFSKEETNNAD